MIGTCEAFVYGHKAGLNLEEMVGLLGKGAASSFTLNKWMPRALKRDFEPGFYVEHFLKDLNICLEEMKRMNLELPGLKLAIELYDKLMAMDGARLGTQGLLLVLEKMNEVECD